MMQDGVDDQSLAAHEEYAMFASIFAHIPSSMEITERLMGLEESSSSITISVVIIGGFAMAWLLYYGSRE